ncbi:peptide-methionine (R)-S-oxide reductase [Saccharobesus litoralis]|uniref:Peptide methionine sulfoxide reductase MsrB n=1 Tax=Saccharobesus litoralis TaxID=2172099 RepID=A0A2S0VXT5_9ALTE|nr:peptide-methionine (R)-S-oxide reductase MsrB [Saccharobesus litoralis]AWB69039.1 peptide-methionine (R)-S-oxide reductase [Saccharobesus litoralis]
MKDHDYWRDKLDTDTFRITREAGTEYPFSGALLHQKSPGQFSCACCDTPLFTHEHKFDSGCGWPSFYDAIDWQRIDFIDDLSHGMVRIEIRCKNCDAHLGHIFDDGPAPTGKRFCVNSLSMQFHPEAKP